MMFEIDHLRAAAAGMPSRCIRSSRERPHILWPIKSTISAIRLARRMFGKAISGNLSLKGHRPHSRCLCCHRFSASLIFTNWLWTGKSWRRRLCRPCRCRLAFPQSGQIPTGFAVAEQSRFLQPEGRYPDLRSVGPL